MARKRINSKKAHIGILLLCLLICFVPLAGSALNVHSFDGSAAADEVRDRIIVAERNMHLKNGYVEISEGLKSINGAALFLNTYSLLNGDTVVTGSLREKASEDCVIASFHIDGEAVLHIHNNDYYYIKPLAEGIIEGGLVFIDSEHLDIACYTPKQYSFVENDCLEYLPGKDGFIRATASDDGYNLEIVSKATEGGTCSDFMYTYGKKDMLDWSDYKTDAEWDTYSFDNHSRMTFTGYYMLTEANYVPFGENIFYRCQACYIADRFQRENMQNRAAQNFLTAIVDTMLQQQNELGYFPSTVYSTWLQGEYGLVPPYYDTRFNSDLAEILIDYYQQYGCREAYTALQKYLEFYLDMVSKTAWDDGNGGLWVHDYWAEGFDNSQVHTGMNHQVAEIMVLYKLSDIFEKYDLKLLADRMTRAITNVGMRWVRPQGDFHYQINVDGSLSNEDYYTLTYNDLYELQEFLEKDYGYRNPVLDEMMEAKLRWMKANGVHDYLGEETE